MPVSQAEQEVGIRSGALDVALVRLPIDREGLHVDSVYFQSGRFLDVGTPDGITAAAGFPIVWNGLDPLPA